MRAFEAAHCDLAICLGDVTDTEEDHEAEKHNVAKISAVLSEAKIPTRCVMGNHDAFTFAPEEFYAILGRQTKPEPIFTKEYSLLFLDACYFSDGTHYAPGDDNWMDTFYPQVDALEAELAKAPGDIYVFMHQNLDPNIHVSHRLSNDAQVRRALEACGRVRHVFQGHYHDGAESIVNGIRYTTLPAMCENEDAYRIFEIENKTK